MRIAFVVTGGLHPSGRQQVMPAWLTLLERLARRHDVHAFALRHLDAPQDYPLRGFTVHDLGSPTMGAGLRRLAQRHALIDALRRHGPFDVIHAFWVDPAGVLAALCGRQLGIPSVVTCNSGEFVSLPDIDYGMQRHRRGRVLVKAALTLASRVHVATHYMEKLAHAHGYDVVRIPIGVDVDAMRLRDPRVEGPPWRLLQVASLNRVKDQAAVLRAVASATHEIAVHLDLVGEDTLGGELQRLAHELGIAPRVTFHGYVPHDELAPFYHRAHLYVQSSRHEAAGAAVLDAAAAELPIVGTRVGYVHDWAGEAAEPVAPGDHAALGRAIVTLLDSPERRRQRAGNARSLASAHDVDWSAAALVDVYSTVRAR